MGASREGQAMSAPQTVDFAAQRTDESSAYRDAVTGFKNYWYPVCKASRVTEKPMARVLLGEPVMLVRRHGVAYAVADQCSHRGTQLSVGYNEFPETSTIVCRYHGWTFDLATGKCVAVLCEGPDSAAIGKRNVRTYPLQERAGIIWIWMGRSTPVPLEDDVPRFLLRQDAVVRVRQRTLYGNWRWHAENVAGGHAQLVHKYSIRQYFERPVAYPSAVEPRRYSDADGEGLISGNRFLEHVESGRYPGLGEWPRRPSWLRRVVLAIVPNPAFRPVEGLTESMLRLPGIYRVLHHPIRDCIYYEWWVPVDADHYVYFQVTTAHPKNGWQRFWFDVKYYLWGLPIGVVLFNNQDSFMVKQTTDYVKRAGWVHLSKSTRQDNLHMLWRELCDRSARGVGTPTKETVEVTEH